jgi:hypothetical protein
VHLGVWQWNQNLSLECSLKRGGKVVIPNEKETKQLSEKVKKVYGAIPYEIKDARHVGADVEMIASGYKQAFKDDPLNKIRKYNWCWVKNEMMQFFKNWDKKYNENDWSIDEFSPDIRVDLKVIFSLRVMILLAKKDKEMLVFKRKEYIMLMFSGKEKRISGNNRQRYKDKKDGCRRSLTVLAECYI